MKFIEKQEQRRVTHTISTRCRLQKTPNRAMFRVSSWCPFGSSSHRMCTHPGNFRHELSAFYAQMKITTKFIQTRCGRGTKTNLPVESTSTFRSLLRIAFSSSARCQYFPGKGLPSDAPAFSHMLMASSRA